MPEMFGLMAVANMLIFGLHLFSDVGLSQNLIQSKRGNESEYINTVWTVQIFRGVLIFFLGLLLALGLYTLNLFNMWPPKSVYAEPILPYIIAVCSLNALISGFNSTKSALAARNLSIGRNTLIDFVTQIIGIIIMVSWAYVDHSVWALVVGSLISSIFGVFASHFFLPGAPNRFHWDHEAFNEIFEFGKWIFLSSILGFLSGSGDRLILGGLIDAKSLGLYAVAITIAGAVQDILYRLSSNIGFSAFSEVYRERPAQLKEVYYKLRKLLDMVYLTVSGFLFVAGHLIIEFLYDDRYKSSGQMLEILSVGLIFVRYGLAEQCYTAIGKPRYNVLLIGVRMIAMFTSLPIAYHFFDLEGALWAIGANALASFPLAIYLKIKNNLFDLKREIIVLPFIFVGAILGLIAIEGVKYLQIKF